MSRDEFAHKIDVWVQLIRISQGLLESVEADLKRAEHPPLAWYDALLELRRVGEAGLRPFALQERMLLAQYNLSRLTDRLVKAGYAERLPCPDDGRGHVLVITAAGRELIKRMWPVYRAAIDRHFAGRVSARGEKAWRNPEQATLLMNYADILCEAAHLRHV